MRNEGILEGYDIMYTKIASWTSKILFEKCSYNVWLMWQSAGTGFLNLLMVEHMEVTNVQFKSFARTCWYVDKIIIIIIIIIIWIYIAPFSEIRLKEL